MHVEQPITGEAAPPAHIEPEEALSRLQALFGEPSSQMLELVQQRNHELLENGGALATGRVFDHVAIRELATGRAKYLEAIVWSSVTKSELLVIPAASLATAMTQTPEELHPIFSLLISLPSTHMFDVTYITAAGIAKLLRPSNPYALTMASVVYAASAHNLPVATSRPAPLKALNPEILVDLTPQLSLPAHK
ncbi:hypothetical protein [Streptosporangium carneum]|uniref:Uncharacterized protein n=1 Tax=Streptosporangium carneum TaxID=47481 RepID=A0A9W6HXB1_9ACTN|nr:hypothetical protein [Streptosporangium carneum]GLK07298.1 hypothetical protein GCM10017600_07030 [Streptosporangium carneum]